MNFQMFEQTRSFNVVDKSTFWSRIKINNQLSWHQCFIDENYILNNVDKIAHIPATIIHGRYDLVCKAEAAYSLHSSLPNSVLHIVPEAGHSASEPGIAGALVRATQQFADFSIIKET